MTGDTNILRVCPKHIHLNMRISSRYIMAIVFFPADGEDRRDCRRSSTPPDRWRRTIATRVYDREQERKTEKETGWKKQTGEELWRRSVPGSDLSARGTCHARNADAKWEHRAAAFIAEKPLSSFDLKFRGQRKFTVVSRDYKNRFVLTEI